MRLEWNEVDVQCKPSGVRVKGLEWNEMEMSECKSNEVRVEGFEWTLDVIVSQMEWKWKDLNEFKWMWM